MNATGPAQPTTMTQVVDRIAAALGTSCRWHWIDSTTLVAEGVQPWSELPLWLPGNDYAGMARADSSRALAAGLAFRPVGETIADTLAWDRSEPGDRPTLAHEKEQEILAAR